MNKWIFFSLILVMLLLLTQKNIIEGYDEKIINSSFENCARFCKMTAQCAGFDYDYKNKICYPSRNPILGKPGSSIYKDEYQQSNIRCNKPFVIQEPINEVSSALKRPNGTFVCYNLDKYQETKNKLDANEKLDDSNPKKYVFHNRDYYELVDGTSPPEYDDYNVNGYTWPGINDIDIKQKSWHELAPLYKVKQNIDLDERIEENALSPVVDRVVVDGYRFSPKYNQGDFLHDFQCVDDVPLENCFEYCNQNSECVGFEYNPQYEELIEKDGKQYIMVRKNLCCPKKTKGSFQNRPKRFKQGKFYYKDKIDVTNKLNGQIISL